MAPVKGWDIEFHMLDAGYMGKHKDLSDCDKSQIAMTRQLGQSMSSLNVKSCGVFLVHSKK